MISTNDLRTGVTIEFEGAVWSVVDFQHVKPGKGSAFVRTRLKNVRTGQVMEKTFRAGEKLPRARLDRREVQYLYGLGDEFTFMDTETYEQFVLTRDQLRDALRYLKENLTLHIVFHEATALGVELPNVVELAVAETDPGVRGDTAAGGGKPARLETGLVVQVPFFIDVGDVLRVDTRTGMYVERA
ncbi:MAG TPA: elongation factor P [Clostridiales bacterium]|nr:elongation factor P [Clostridiales bacterium]